MVRQRRMVQAMLACSAAAGLVGAHAIAYLIALPDATVRAAMLRTTGHGYFSAAVVVAVIAAVFGALAAAALGLRRSDAERVILPWHHAALRIALVQSAGFVSLEIAERAATNISPLAVNPRLVGLGIAVQVALACLSALVLTLIGRAAASIAEALLSRPRAQRANRIRVRVFGALGPRPVFAAVAQARAPPVVPR